MAGSSPSPKREAAAAKGNVVMEAHPGYKDEEAPRAFIHEAVRREAREIQEHWDTERHSYFKLRADDVHRYVLRCDMDALTWELVMREGR